MVESPTEKAYREIVGVRMINLKLTINFVSSCNDSSMLQQNLTWEDMRGLLSRKHLRKGTLTLAEYQAGSDKERKTEKDGTGWIPCSVLDQGGRRNQENMGQTHLLVLDIDTGMGLDDVKIRINGYEAVIHSTYSHSPEKPKWRVVLPLLTPIPAGDVGAIFDHFQERFDGLLDASCGHDSSRLFYLPACPSDAEHLFVFEHLKGQLLDPAPLLNAPATATPNGLPKPGKSLPTIGRPAGVAEGDRNNDIFKHACQLFRAGQSSEDAVAVCLKRNQMNKPPLDEDEVQAAVASAFSHVSRRNLTATSDADAQVELLNRDFAWVEKQGRVYRFKFRDFVHFDQLRQQYANTSKRINVGGSEKWLNHAEIWHRSDKRRTHANVTFIPGGDSIVDNCINFWEGWGAAPAAGDISPWSELLDHLFSGAPEMRQWFEKWLAYPVQHPGVKLTTATVLWSGKQGVGKSMIGETIGRLYGSHFRTISSAELHGSFNGWMRDCQFVLGEENSSSDQRADANRLKFLITGLTIFVNEKHQPAIELNNCANFLFTSNHADAFYLEDADRRFFIWEIVADRKPNEFYDRFIDWRDNHGGLSALMSHLLNLDLAGFSPKGNAPVTEAKREMIRQSKTDLERWLSDVLEDHASVIATFGKEIIHLDDLTKIYCRERGCRATSTAVTRAFRRQNTYAKRRVVTKEGRQSLVSLVNHEKWELADNADWAAEYERPTPVRL